MVTVKPKQHVAAFVLASHYIFCVVFFKSLEGAANGASSASRVGRVPALIQSSGPLEAIAMDAFEKFLETSAASLHGDLGLPLNTKQKEQYVREALMEYSQFVNTIVKGLKTPEANTIDTGDTQLNSEYRAAISGLSSREPRESNDPNGNGSPFIFRKTEELKIAQRDWIRHRDTSARWFHTLNPAVDEAAWKCWLSETRAAQIRETDLESEVWQRLRVQHADQSGILELEQSGNLLDDKQFLEAFAWIQQCVSTRYSKQGTVAYVEFVEAHLARLERCVKMEMRKPVLEAYNASVKKQAADQARRKKELHLEINKLSEGVPNGGGTMISDMIVGGHYRDSNHRIAGLKPWIIYAPDHLKGDLSIVCELSAAFLKKEN